MTTDASDGAHRRLPPARPGTWRILHISDLHFVQPVQYLMWGIRNRTIPQRHHVALLQALVTACRRDLAPVDLVVVSGDVSSNGSSRSLGFAHDYLSLDRVERPVGRVSLKLDGLALAPERLVVVPGNHDRYRYLPVQWARRRRLEATFAAEHSAEGDLLPKGFPARIRIEDATEQSTGQGAEPGERAPTLTFTLLDSSLGASRLSRARNPLKSIAVGLVTAEDLTAVMSPTAGEGVHIVVLHHHPIISVRLQRTAQRRRFSGLTEMMNADDLREACRGAGVDMVLYGHRHFVDCVQPRLPEDQPGPAFFCSRSTTEARGRSSNDVERLAGFWFYELSASRVIATDYVWGGREFEPRRRFETALASSARARAAGGVA